MGVYRVPVSIAAKHAGGALAAVLAVSMTVAGCGTPDRPDPAVRTSQCAYTDHDLTAFAEFERLVGTDLDCAVMFSDITSTWAEWAEPWFITTSEPAHQWVDWARDPGHRLVITQSLIPAEAPDDWRARGSRGEYEEHARELARNLVAAGLGASVIRLAHEANGTWYRHQIGKTEQERRDWADFWARTARAMESVSGAEFTFDWTINGGYRPIPFDQYYPGDDVVDIVGVDQYDSLLDNPGLTGERRWEAIRDQPGGLAEAARFARQHGKRLSIPETGLLPTTEHGAGDDPAFVTGLFDFMAENDVSYVGYFNKNVDGVLRLEQAPNAAAHWRAETASADGPR